MTQEILDKIRQEAEGYHSRKLIGSPENEVGAYISGAKRGYELAMLEAKKLKDALENIMVMVGSSELSKSDWKYYDEVKLLIANDSPTPEPGKEYTREQMKDFLEWASLHCFNKFIDGKWSWGYKEKYKRIEIGWLTTDQLLTEYLNSKK